MKNPVLSVTAILFLLLMGKGLVAILLSAEVDRHEVSSVEGEGFVQVQARTEPPNRNRGMIDISRGFETDPIAIQVQAGGLKSARDLARGCRGYISELPNITLNYQTNTQNLNIYAIADSGDLTLVVRLPSGRYLCNDDYFELNPALLMRDPGRGVYQIWVGAHDYQMPRSTLLISQLEPNFTYLPEVPPSYDHHSDDHLISWVQESLEILGYSPGRIDGVMDARTEAALRQFQGDNGFPVDGKPTWQMAVLLDLAVTLLDEMPDTQVLEVAVTGTGFYVDADGHAVTNEHVVEDCPKVTVEDVSGELPAEIIARDPEKDLALLRVMQSSSRGLTFRNSDPQLGEDVIVIGFPLRVFLAGINLTTGSVSSTTGFQGDTDMLQISAPVQGGNSGGPLLDQSGLVIGVVVAKLDALVVAEMTGDVPQNVNFAIQPSVVKSFLTDHDVQPSLSNDLRPEPRTSIARVAGQSTLLVKCWR